MFVLLELRKVSRKSPNESDRIMNQANPSSTIRSMGQYSQRGIGLIHYTI
jgi:hypothetical protein